MHERLIAFLERRPAVRWLLYVVLGAGIFAIGASYLRLQIRPDPVAFQVTGGDLLASGWPATFRIRARTAHLGQAHAVTVRGVRLGDRDLPFTSRDADPLTLTVEMPGDIAAGALQKMLVLQLEAGQTQRKVSLAMAMTGADPGGETPVERAGALAPTRRKLRLDLHPETGDLVSHLDNRVFVRVRYTDGRPMAGATATLSHSDFVGGQMTLITDGAGLSSFVIKPKLPNFDVRVTVVAPNEPELTETFNETLYAVGRQLMFADLPPVIAPDRTHSFRILTTRENGDIFCDLRRGRTHIAGLRLPIEPSREVTTSLPALSRPGRYDLQCYLNILIPGTTFASRAFWVGDPHNPEPVLEAARRSGLFGGPSLDVSKGSISGPDAEFAAWLTSRLGERAVLTDVLAQTFEGAVKEADDAWERAKDMALATLGLAIFLILLVGLDLVLQNILSNRRRFRAYEAALADEGALGDISLDGVDIAARQSTDRLSRTRGWLFLIVAVGTLLANIVGFLMLSGMFKG